MKNLKDILKQLSSTNENERNQVRKMIEAFSHNLASSSLILENGFPLHNKVEQEEARKRLEKTSQLVPFSDLYDAINV